MAQESADEDEQGFERAGPAPRPEHPKRRRIALVAPGPGGPEMRVRTETEQRILTGSRQGGALVVELPANDPLLDAMAITRGRFAIEPTGAPGLYIPAWAEVTRVIEDCR